MQRSNSFIFIMLTRVFSSPFVFNNLCGSRLNLFRARSTAEYDKMPASFLLPGVLQDFDLSDVCAALAPGPLRVKTR